VKLNLTGAELRPTGKCESIPKRKIPYIVTQKMRTIKLGKIRMPIRVAVSGRATTGVPGVDRGSVKSWQKALV